LGTSALENGLVSLQRKTVRTKQLFELCRKKELRRSLLTKYSHALLQRRVDSLTLSKIKLKQASLLQLNMEP
jgi:hypothetical protein